MLFNPDTTKPAQEVIFSRKKDDSAHPNIFFNDIPVKRASHQKHLDEKLNFKMHNETVLCKVNKRISIIKKLGHTLPRKSLLIIYKVFLRPHIDHDDESFCEKLKSVQYKAVFVVTGAIQVASRENIFMELGLRSIKSRWFKRLCCMFKRIKNQAPEYLNNLIPKRKQNFYSRNIYIPGYNCQYFKASFFPASFEEWFLLDPSIRNSETINVLKQKLLPFGCPLENCIFNIFRAEGLKLLTRLRLCFSHLNDHRFGHNFQECLNPLCTCNLEKKNTFHYLLYCHHNTFVLVLRIV